MTVLNAVRRRRFLLIGLAVVLVSQLVLAGVGIAVFANASSDPLRKVDAIVVLGGEHDGREAYGVDLAKSGLASAVLLSNAYGSDDPVMREQCAASTAAVTIICRTPEPFNTKGEAIMTRELADQHGWSSVMVISWRYHLPRARYLFEHCFSSQPGAVSMHEVPRTYDFSPLTWQYTFLYQSAGFAKAMLEGC